MSKKALGPVVATSLFLVVTIVSVIGFQTFFSDYTSGILSETESDSAALTSDSVEGIYGDYLYIKNENNNNVSISNVEIGGLDCGVSGDYGDTMIKLDVSLCLNLLSSFETKEILVVLNDKVLTKKQYLDFYSDSTQFISIWNTSLNDSDSSEQNTILLPLVSNGNYNFTVYWGDGKYDEISSYNDQNVNHTYLNHGIYTVKLSGTVEGWNFWYGISGDNLKILEITQWVNLKLIDHTWGSYFRFCSNLIISSPDSLNLVGITSLYGTFQEATSLKTGLNNWDVSSIQTMGQMFSNAKNFTGNLNNWDVSSVENMKSMFLGATIFNGNIANWNVSNVTNMNRMFEGAFSFNNNIKNWEVSNVQDIGRIFMNADSFNQNIGNWNVSKVEIMNAMFQWADIFNQNLSSWDVDQVTNCANYDAFMSSWNESYKPNFNVSLGC